MSTGEVKSPLATESIRGLHRLAPEPSDDDTVTDIELAQPDIITPDGAQTTEDIDWENEPENPQNWSAWKKTLQVVMLSSTALQASIGTSIMSSAHSDLMQEFSVSSTVALLPLTMYVLGLGLGPVLGGPLSETIGRYPIYAGSMPLGAVFAVGAGFSHTFGVLCFCRFMSGLCWGPVLAVASGSLTETFRPKRRGTVSAVFILMPFLGPGLGPVIGSILVNRHGWRSTQWALALLSVFCIVTVALTEETFRPAIMRRIVKQRGGRIEHSPLWKTRVKELVFVSVVRPLRMLVVEPIVLFLCLYVSAEFGTLFSFFAAVPYTFGMVYHFDIEQSGLVFASIIIGCCLGLFTIILCDLLIYRKQAARYALTKTPPEHRLYSAMIGSFGPPVALFWFGWTAREEISWSSPAASIILFSWGNLCIYVSAIVYISETYPGSLVASAISANTLARYGFAAAFPLFALPMYKTLGIDWASGLLGFIALALLPVPWVLFRYGPQIRARSQYETVKYGK
ncbi:major facilitator superfamily domain-containing protein [Ilyonectria destructans]|nr:major facilitator superfamily domain-containing protein [Ilyonectria destructans]